MRSNIMTALGRYRYLILAATVFLYPSASTGHA